MFRDTTLLKQHISLFLVVCILILRLFPQAFLNSLYLNI